MEPLPNLTSKTCETTDDNFEENTFTTDSCLKHQNKSKKIESQDLDLCIQNILTWELCITNLNAKVHDLTKENESLQDQVNFLTKNGSVNKSIINDLQSTVKTLQVILQQRLDQKEKITSLQESLQVQEEKVKLSEKQLMLKTQALKDQQQILQSKHNKNMVQLRKELNDHFTEREKEWNESLIFLKRELETECNKRKEVEKNHEKETVKMQLEYEKKIALLQVQSSRLHSNSNNINSTNSEVFRKKLQHIQEESSREINRLKQEVSLLQLKLSSKINSNEDRSSPQLTGSRPGILKRRRGRID